MDENKRPSPNQQSTADTEACTDASPRRSGARPVFVSARVCAEQTHEPVKSRVDSNRMPSVRAKGKAYCAGSSTGASVREIPRATQTPDQKRQPEHRKITRRISCGSSSDDKNDTDRGSLGDQRAEIIAERIAQKPRPRRRGEVAAHGIRIAVAKQVVTGQQSASSARSTTPRST